MTMERKEIKTPYGNYTFVNETNSTRSGFSHVSKMFIEGLSWPVSSGKCDYLNRTWELYRYQSSMTKAVRRLINERKAIIEADYRQLAGITRMTAKKRDELNKIIDADDLIEEYRTLEEELEKAH